MWASIADFFRRKHYAVSCHGCESMVPVADIYALNICCPRCDYRGTYEDIEVQEAHREPRGI